MRGRLSEHADRGRLEAVAEGVGVAVGEDREAVAEVPAEVVVEQADVGAGVVAVGVREPGGVGVERDPIDDAFLAGRAALGLQAVVHADADGREVVGDFARGRRDPILQAGAERVRTADRISDR